MDRLAQILERIEAANLPPLEEKCGLLKHYVYSKDTDETFGFSVQEMHPRDGRDVPAHEYATLMAHAPADLSYLLARVARLERALEDLSHANDKHYIDGMPAPMYTNQEIARMARAALRDESQAGPSCTCPCQGFCLEDEPRAEES